MTKETRTREPGQSASVLQDIRPVTFGSRVGRLQLSRYSGVFILIAIIVVFSIWIPQTFLTPTTGRTILQTQAITALLAIGLLFPLSAGAYDLSAAQNLGFTALLCGALMTKAGLPVAVAIPLTLLVGMTVGAVNGVLVAVVGLDSFIATLGMTSILLALAAIVSGGAYIGPFVEEFNGITSPAPLGVPILALYVLVFGIISWWVLEHTPAGRRAQATGANFEAARLAGIRTRRYVFGTLLVSGLVASGAGVLLASSLGTVSQQIGPQYLLPAFAAAFLGATQFKPGRFNVWGTILAIYLLGTGVYGLQLVGGSIWVTDIFNGVALIVAVSVNLVASRIRRRRALGTAPTGPAVS